MLKCVFLVPQMFGDSEGSGTPSVELQQKQGEMMLKRFAHDRKERPLKMNSCIFYTGAAL